MTSWTARAQALADIEDLAAAAIAAAASGWATGLDPDATRGLTAAALGLGADPAALFGTGEPYADDTAMLDAAQALADDVALRLSAARQLAADAAAALDEAAEDLAAGDDEDQDHEAAAAARWAIAGIEAAQAALAPLIQRLVYVLDRLWRVPADLAETYQAAQAHVRTGGVLPHQGRWISGADQRAQVWAPGGAGVLARPGGRQ